jgi:hypothetical protein
MDWFCTVDWSAFQQVFQSDKHLIGKANTKHVERDCGSQGVNLCLRTRNRRTVRRTACFSKKEINRFNAMKLVMHDLTIVLFRPQPNIYLYDAVKFVNFTKLLIICLEHVRILKKGISCIVCKRPNSTKDANSVRRANRYPIAIYRTNSKGKTQAKIFFTFNSQWHTSYFAYRLPIRAEPVAKPNKKVFLLADPLLLSQMATEWHIGTIE